MDNSDLLTNATTLIERFRAEAAATTSEIDRLTVKLEIINETLDALCGTRQRPRRQRKAPEPALLPDMQPADYLVPESAA